MAAKDTLGRVVPWALSAFEDDDLRRQLQDAIATGRPAFRSPRIGRTPTPATRLERASESVRAASGALGTFRRLDPEPPAPSHRGRTAIALIAGGGLVAAVAARRPNNEQRGDG